MKHIVANRFLFSAAIFLMYISIQKYELLGSEQRTELGVRTDGDGQNLIAAKRRNSASTNHLEFICITIFKVKTQYLFSNRGFLCSMCGQRADPLRPSPQLFSALFITFLLIYKPPSRTRCGWYPVSEAKVFTGCTPLQDQAAGRFCEKSSSFPSGERISRKNLDMG